MQAPVTFKLRAQWPGSPWSLCSSEVHPRMAESEALASPVTRYKISIFQPEVN